jgi:hypothetical protein
MEMRESRRQRHSSQIRQSTRALALPLHRPSLVPPPCPPLLCVLAVILFSAAPTTCSGPRPPSPPSPALPLSHLPLWRLGMRTAHAPLHLHTRQPLASRLLAARLLVCSLVCLLARVLAHSPFLTCRPPASPPQTHDCPAVMGLRLVFASGGGSPWFNFIWSSN